MFHDCFFVTILSAVGCVHCQFLGFGRVESGACNLQHIGFSACFNFFCSLSTVNQLRGHLLGSAKGLLDLFLLDRATADQFVFARKFAQRQIC